MITLSFFLYLRHGFNSESEDAKENKVNHIMYAKNLSNFLENITTVKVL